jgi:hypothetical protein
MSRCVWIEAGGPRAELKTEPEPSRRMANGAWRACISRAGGWSAPLPGRGEASLAPAVPLMNIILAEAAGHSGARAKPN